MQKRFLKLKELESLMNIKANGSESGVNLIKSKIYSKNINLCENIKNNAAIGITY
jgi:hypothetical protein